MLARQLPGVSVLTCPDRYRAGRFAEEHLGASVHVLDDGFQHLQLERDIDLLILAREDIEQPVTLPGGRLREPLDTIVAADALLTTDPAVMVEVTGTDLPVFQLQRSGAVAPPDSMPALAVAGIASPERFFADLRANCWNIAQTMVFADHCRYTARDVARLMAEASRLGAARIVTTEKDLVRLLPFRPFPVPVIHLPYVLEPHPLDRFRDWLMNGLRDVRGETRG
jgi:tetraacyldisaccharide 4'-kinase